MTGKSRIAPAGAHPRLIDPEQPQPASECRDAQAALSLLRSFRSRRPLRHGASLESNLQDLIDEWHRHG